MDLKKGSGGPSALSESRADDGESGGGIGTVRFAERLGRFWWTLTVDELDYLLITSVGGDNVLGGMCKPRVGRTRRWD